MTFYMLHFADGSKHQLAITFMTTEAWRKANGGLSNIEIVLARAKEIHPRKQLVKVVRKIGNHTVWELKEPMRA